MLHKVASVIHFSLPSNQFSISVCRLLVTELYESFNKTNKKGVLMTGYELDDLDEKKTIVYDKS